MEWAAMCGMSEHEFWDCTPRFMSAKIKALEAAHRLSWEQSRFIAFFGERATGKSIAQFYRFDWEKPRFSPISTAELDQFSREADEALIKHLSNAN